MDVSGISGSLSPKKKLFDTAASEKSGTTPTKDLADNFSDFLSDKLSEVESRQKQAQKKMQLFAAGEIDDVHDVTVAQQKAQLAIKLTNVVRSKLLQGYQKLSQMQ